MDQIFQPQNLVALVVGIIAYVTNSRTGKIFNWLTFPAAGIGLLLNGSQFGSHGVFYSVVCYLGIIPILLRLQPPPQMGVVKLAAAIGAILGLSKSLVFMLSFVITLIAVTFEPLARKVNIWDSERNRANVHYTAVILTAILCSILTSPYLHTLEISILNGTY